MPTLHVDSSLIPGVSGPITVDALLSAVEPVLAQSGRIVTGVRINGVEEPAFREPDVLALALASDATVDVDTTPVATMAVQALDDALQYLPALGEDARSLAAAFRQPDGERHQSALVGLADNLALMAALVHTADLWAGQAGLAVRDWLGDDVAAVEQAAAALQSAAERGDWPEVAEALDCRLVGALEGWQHRLADGRTQVLALAPAAVA